MSHERVRYLLIGGGAAASNAAAAIRSRDADGAILLVTQEIHRPYNRPPLSKEFLRHQGSREALFTHPGPWFEQNRIALRTGLRIARIDPDRHSATLENGDELGFERLLLATGAVPRPLEVPGAALPGTYTLRSIEDALHLQTAIDKARRDGRPHRLSPGKRGRATVIGGGLLGVEISASLAQLGMEIDLVLAENHPWARFAGDAIGSAIAKHLEARGVTLHPGSPATALEGDGRVQRVRMSDGRAIDCDFAVAAVGALTNKSLLRGTSISAENAILVDEYCQTNIPGIFAAGDCAAILDPLFGKHRIIDHWEHAAVSGALAGRNMAGAHERYNAVNFFSSEVFGLTLGAWGESKLVYRRLVRAQASPPASVSTPPSPSLIEFGIAADDRICQVLALGGAESPETLKQFVARRLAVDGNAESLKDPAIPLEQLLG